MFKSSEKTTLAIYLAGIAGIIYGITQGLGGEYWLASFLWAGFCTACLGEGFLHRYLTHRTYKLQRWKVIVLSYLTTVTLAMGAPMGWAALHRAHHKHADTEKDPHSPHTTSLSKLISFRFNYTGTMHSSRDFLNDRFQMFLHRYYIPLTLSWVSLIWLAFGFDWMVALVAIPWTINVIMAGLSAYFGHAEIGLWKRPHEVGDRSVNSLAALIVSFGSSGTHNNHHLKPWAWDTREKWYHIDTAAWFISAIRDR